MLLLLLLIFIIFLNKMLFAALGLGLGILDTALYLNQLIREPGTLLALRPFPETLYYVSKIIHRKVRKYFLMWRMRE